jgi:hypothetical protein
MSGKELVQYEVKGQIGTIWINRPEVKNCINHVPNCDPSRFTRIGVGTNESLVPTLNLEGRSKVLLVRLCFSSSWLPS